MFSLCLFSIYLPLDFASRVMELLWQETCSWSGFFLNQNSWSGYQLCTVLMQLTQVIHHLWQCWLTDTKKTPKHCLIGFKGAETRDLVTIFHIFIINSFLHLRYGGFGSEVTWIFICNLFLEWKIIDDLGKKNPHLRYCHDNILHLSFALLVNASW